MTWVTAARRSSITITINEIQKGSFAEPFFLATEFPHCPSTDPPDADRECSLLDRREVFGDQAIEKMLHSMLRSSLNYLVAPIGDENAGCACSLRCRQSCDRLLMQHWSRMWLVVLCVILVLCGLVPSAPAPSGPTLRRTDLNFAMVL